jgi:hypothetical protein
LLIFVSQAAGILNSYLSVCIVGAVSSSGFHISFRNLVGIAVDRLKDYWAFVLCLSSGNLKALKNTTFRKLDLFPSSGEGMGTSTLLGPLTRADPSHCTTYVKAKVKVASPPTASQSRRLDVEPHVGLMIRF